MPSTIEAEKRELRRLVRDQLSAMTPAERKASDEALFARFFALAQVEEARTIFAFWGIPGKEPETEQLVKKLVLQGKTVGLPRMLPNSQMEVRRFDLDKPLLQATFGISEPGEDCPLIGQEEIDLALIPAMCYDSRGFRLGFGGGYYDRWLERFSGLRVGLCRQAVFRDRVPIQEHDAKVDILITEEASLSL